KTDLRRHADVRGRNRVPPRGPDPARPPVTGDRERQRRVYALHVPPERRRAGRRVRRDRLLARPALQKGRPETGEGGNARGAALHRRPGPPQERIHRPAENQAEGHRRREEQRDRFQTALMRPNDEETEMTVTKRPGLARPDVLVLLALVAFVAGLVLPAVAK